MRHAASPVSATRTGSSPAQRRDLATAQDSELADVSATDIAAADALAADVLEFCRLLKGAGLNVTPGRVIDVFRAIRFVALVNRDEFRLALQVNLVSTREEEQIFRTLFEEYWVRRCAPRVVPTDIHVEAQRDESAAKRRKVILETLGQLQQYSPDDVSRDKRFLHEWSEGWQSFERVLRDLARRLATRPSRRFEPARTGSRIDLRNSLRKNMRYGMDVIQLARGRRKIRKTRVVLLCDVSGSMDTYSPFLLQLMFAVQKRLKNSRTLVFSTRSTEITRPLRRWSVAEALREVTQLARHWSGGTNIGNALSHLNRQVMPEGSASSRICVIISDGYDQGDPEVITREMYMLRRRVRAVVWINPLLGTEGYAPVTSGMRAALPCIDHFLAANDLASLRALCRTLGEL